MTVLVASAVKSVPVEDFKPNLQQVLKFENFDKPAYVEPSLFYGVNKEVGVREFAVADEEINYRLPNNSMPI